MAVYVSNIVIEQGFDFDTSFELEDTRTNAALDLTTASIESKLRKHYGSSTATTFTSSITNPEGGVVTISLSSTQTVDLKPGRYVYDVKVTNSGKIFKVVEGAAIVRAGVTR